MLMATEMTGGRRATLVKELHVTPLFTHTPVFLLNTAVVTTTTENNNKYCASLV